MLFSVISSSQAKQTLCTVVPVVIPRFYLRAPAPESGSPGHCSLARVSWSLFSSPRQKLGLELVWFSAAQTDLELLILLPPKLETIRKRKAELDVFVWQV